MHAGSGKPNQSIAERVIADASPHATSASHESQIEGREHQDDSNIDNESLPESVSEEREI
jgi:hypothetical protein